MLTKNQFDIIYLLSKDQTLSQRALSLKSGLSLGLINKNVKELKLNGLVDDMYKLTTLGKKKLDHFKVDNAIILAAGMSTRFAPVSYELPKGLTVVKGEVLIERQIRQLIEAGVKEIIVVVGHMLEKFFYLREKYGVKLVVNNDYKTKNTHSSIFAARDYLKNTYICCSDNYYPNNLFNSHEYRSNYCAQYLEGESRTERGLITDKDGLIIATEKPCKDAWTMQGHAFLNSEFCTTFKSILESYYGKSGTENLYWEGIYAEHLDQLPMYIRKCDPNDILEFDSVENLREFDPDYIIHNNLQVIRNICKVLNAKPEDIKNITPISGGMTNKSFSFVCRGGQYIYRDPGKNTVGYIDRDREKFALKIAKGLGIDKSYLHEDETYGWKISYFINVTEPFDFNNKHHLSKLCDHLHSLHKAGIKCGSKFDFFVEADKLIERLKLLDIWAAQDLISLKKQISPIYENIKEDNWPVVLSHNDIYEPNLLISGDDLYLIDWEYAGDSDTGYDLSKLFSAADVPLELIDDYLSNYYGRKPTSEEKRHILGCATVNYYYWYVWAIYQSRSGNECSEWQMIWHNKMNKYLTETLRLIEKE